MLTARTACYLLLCASVSAVAQPQWQALASGTEASLRGISVVDEGVIWVSGSDATVIRSVDGGETWQDRAPRLDTALDFRDVQAFSADDAIIMSAGPGPQSRLYVTSDGGGNWRLVHQNTHAEGFYDGMAFWDRQRGILYGDPVAGRFFGAAGAD